MRHKIYNTPVGYDVEVRDHAWGSAWGLVREASNQDVPPEWEEDTLLKLVSYKTEHEIRRVKVLFYTLQAQIRVLTGTP